MLHASVTFCYVKNRLGRKFERCNIGGELKLDGTAIFRLAREAVAASQAFEVRDPQPAGGFGCTSACQSKLWCWYDSLDILSSLNH